MHAGRCLRRLTAAGLHLRSWRAGDLPAALWCHGHAARECFAAEHDRDHRKLSGDGLLHGPDCLSRHAGGDGEGADLSRLRAAVSAGETLPAPVYDDWMQKTGKPMLDGIGATELLHIFISNRFDDPSPACTGKPVTGYEARSSTRHGTTCRAAKSGGLPCAGPTGCRYLADARQTDYVQDGWNVTGDSSSWTRRLPAFRRPQRRYDRLVGLQHRRARGRSGLACPSGSRECGVIGVADDARGQIVQAHVVLAEGWAAVRETVKTLAGSRQGNDRALQIPALVSSSTRCPRPRPARSSAFASRRA